MTDRLFLVPRTIHVTIEAVDPSVQSFEEAVFEVVESDFLERLPVGTKLKLVGMERED